ncbi:MAG: DNA-binding response regulator [Lachnospiraceae bacterium]|nr:DNA-binding response regulator [Lachnospiraceae bacterium]
MIRVAICDDEIGTCSDIENIVLNYARRQALKIDTEVFYSGETLFQAIENKDNYDRVFLDIQLLELDGVQVGKQIREQLGNERIRNDFFFPIGKSIQRLYLDEIFYFACNGKRIDIYSDMGVTTFYGTMREVAEQVNGKGVWIIHKSYIVNSSYVSIYQYDTVQMTDGTILPISPKYRKLMKACLTELYRKR